MTATTTRKAATMRHYRITTRLSVRGGSPAATGVTINDGQWATWLGGPDQHFAEMHARNLTDLADQLAAFISEHYGVRDADQRVAVYVEVLDGKRAPNGFARLFLNRVHELHTGRVLVFDYSARKYVPAD